MHGREICICTHKDFFLSNDIFIQKQKYIIIGPDQTSKKNINENNLLMELKRIWIYCTWTKPDQDQLKTTDLQYFHLYVGALRNYETKQHQKEKNYNIK